MSYTITTTFETADQATHHMTARADALEVRLVRLTEETRELQHEAAGLEADAKNLAAELDRVHGSIDSANATIEKLRAELAAEKAKPCKPTVGEMIRFIDIYMNTPVAWGALDFVKKKSLIDKVWGEVKS